ncbi:NADAR family protein [Streptomyces longispororuber]|uniref:NADAR family protein n=1 Tax=Streptomyces longispororuber TaxID=68230 RepID=UPI00210E1179|nr:NADAR family protein [Streptomyces longispororuber]MCQ4211749.1 NADAR family protein [Streptomyces longispororuber]
MTWRGPTYRTVDGERIDGVWSHVWQRLDADHPYCVDDLIVYADGTITWDTDTDLSGLRKLLESGRLSVTDPARPPRSEPPEWGSRLSRPLTTDGFLLEVADQIERLNGRPTSSHRCWEAVRRFQQDPSESHRSLLRAAYLAIPPHLRVYALGDMDQQDRPLRILLTDVGEAVDGGGPVVTAELHQTALDYFARSHRGIQQEQARRAVDYSDDPSGPGRATVVSQETVFPRGWPEEPATFMLRNGCPTPFAHEGESYASVLHAYWSLAAADPADRARIAAAESGRDAQELGGKVPHRPDWPAIRLAVMADLLRAKYTQHEAAAQVLLSTGDSRISYTGLWDSPFWRDTNDAHGRNWMGRLLELTRSELRLRPANSPSPARP